MSKLIDPIQLRTGRYVVEMRANSGATFELGKPLTLRFDAPAGLTVYTFETQRSDVGLGVDTASELVVTVIGPAESLEKAKTAYTMFSNIAGAVISFAANAAVEPVRIVLAYEIPEDDSEGEFFQRYIAPPQPTILQHRRVDLSTMMEVFSAVVPLMDEARIIRALDHYRIAMLHWKPGWDILAFNPLWLCAEVLTPIALAREIKRTGYSRKELYASFGLNPEKYPKNLDSAVRRHLIFHGDVDCYKAAKEASDGIEHGFMDFAEIHDRIRQAKDTTAMHVRKALAEVLSLRDEVLGTLFGAKYGQPLERWEYDHTIQGKIKANAEGNLAAKGERHPFFVWKNVTRAVWRGEDGLLNHQLGGDITARIAPGAEFSHLVNAIHGPKPEMGTISSPSTGNEGSASKPPLTRLGISALCDRVLTAIETIVPPEPTQLSHFDGYMLAMFWRLRSLFEAVKGLLVSNLPEEALILARSMFEESLRLGELRKSEERRNSLLLGWARESLFRQRDILLMATSQKAIDTSEFEGVICERLKQLDIYAAENDVPGPLQFMPIDEAARMLGRSDYVWFFRYAEEVSKGNEMAQITRRRREGDILQIFGKSSDLKFIALVAEFSARSLLWSAEDIAEIFGWGNVACFRELLTELDDL